MNNPFTKKDKRSELEKERDERAAILRSYGPYSAEYEQELLIIERLSAIINEDTKSKNRLNKDTIVNVGGNFAIALLIGLLGKFAEWLVDAKPLQFTRKR